MYMFVLLTLSDHNICVVAQQNVTGINQGRDEDRSLLLCSRLGDLVSRLTIDYGLDNGLARSLC